MKLFKSIHSDVLIGFGLVVASLSILVREMQAGKRKDIFAALNEKILGEKFFPIFVMASMAVFGVILILGSFRHGFKERESISSFLSRTREVWLVLLLSALYCAFLYLFGYLPASIIVLAVLLRVFGQKKWRNTILLSVLLPLVFYLVFERGLLLMLPKGVFF